jgi:hypothetical protein
MRIFTTSLSLFTFLLPAAAFAQEAEAEADSAPLNEAPAEANEPAPETAPAAETAPEASTGSADASASTSAGFSAGTTAAAPLAAPPAATAAAPEPEVKRPAASRRFSEGGGGNWEFSYSGYFRAPMRIGIATNQGPQHTAEMGLGANGEPQNPDGDVVIHEPVPGDNNGDGAIDTANGEVIYQPAGYQKKKTTFHLPVIPDNQYGSWQSTGHNRNDWAEMFFSVGNGKVSGTLAIQAFQFTDASWVAKGAQFGIGQGWVEIDDDLGFENVNFNVKVGSHWARYGMAGLYDGGEYDTYLFGRTHTMGGTARLDLTLSAFDLAFEGGFGANQPDPEMFNRPRFTTAGHGHVFVKFPSVEFSANAMHAWSNASVGPSWPQVLPGSGGCNSNAVGAQCTTAQDQISYPNGTETAGGVDGLNGVWGAEYPTGTQTIVGADARADLGLLGYLYLGYSHQFLKNSLVVGNAIESIHSFGGGMYNLGITDNYLESPYCNRFETNNAITPPNDSCSNGTGTVGTILGQYELGFGNFGFLPSGMDLKMKLYGMVNFVTVDDIEEERLGRLYGPLLPGGFAHDTLPAAGQAITIDDLRQDGTVKWKAGTDFEFFPLDFMSVGVRFDRLDPHSKLKNEGFSILSPRITFRSKMVTHEMISLQYSRYFYDQRACVDQDGNVASPADDPFRPNGTSIYNTPNSATGYPLRLDCVQPPPSAVPPYGFGMHTNNQAAGNRGAASLLPDENVVKLEASMWW